jgi:hypothetical protein
MTQFKPYLFINRLVVITQSGSAAYDETFHKGLNIIRGQNSAGKSTIANFIFFAMGGDYNNWNKEAKKCISVYVELEINDVIITLKRDVTDSLRQPMNIFWGNYEDSIKSNFEGWKHFSYQQTDNKLSYTNVIFNILGFPEVKSEDSNITLHQILRLLYIDQDSPTQSLFKFERFDLPLTRQAISEVLLGIYDDSLYTDRLDLKLNEKFYDEKKKQFDSLSKVLSFSGSETSEVKITKEIENIKQQIINIDIDISKKKEIILTRSKKQSPIKLEYIQKELNPIRIRVNDLNLEIEKYQIEIYDSVLFIETLERRVKAIGNSILTNNILGELPLKNCPECLSPLENHASNESCFLCKQPLIEHSHNTNAQRMKQELEIQIKESKKLLQLKENDLVKSKENFTTYVDKARRLQREMDLVLQENQSTRDEEIDSRLIEKGNLEGKIEYYIKQFKNIELIQNLSKELAYLKSKRETLELNIKLKTNNQRTRNSEALKKIEEYTLIILKKDLDRQNEFKNAKKVDIDFRDNAFSLDNEFNFSACSNTYLKNAIRYGVFFASLELAFFRFPRFILCDNMEDKGMEQIRTQNLQEVISELSKNAKIEHQIIFTTSMVSEKLNSTPSCVGDFYTENKKTLNIH